VIRRRVWKAVLFWCLVAVVAFGAVRIAIRHHRMVELARRESPATPDTTRDMPESFRRLWTEPVPGFCAAGISSDANWIGIIAMEGEPGVGKESVSLWDWRNRPDRPVWVRADYNVDCIELSPNGHFVLTSSRLDPIDHVLSVRNGADGARIIDQDLDGALWDLQVSPDGTFAACVTGQRSVYVMNLSDRPRFHRWQLGGNADTIAISPNNAYLVTGTWDDSGVSCYTLTGALIWQYPADQEQIKAVRDRLFEARLTPDGRYVLGLSYSNVRHRNGELYLWRADGDGTPLWTELLGADTVDPRAAVSQDGRYIAVSYVENITRGAHNVPERLVVMLDRRNQRRWHWGGFLFSPTLVALSPDGQRVTVWDGRRTFYNLNRDGRITSSYAMPRKVSVRSVIATPDGSSLLVYTSDGNLTLLQVAA
jgi:WD40 repeat protein